MSIVLNGKTYNFIGFDRNGVSQFQETSSGVPGGFGYLTCKVDAGGKDPTVKWRLTMPVLATEDSACGCVGTLVRMYRFEDGKTSLPSSGTTLERTDFEQRISDLIATAQYTASIVNLVQPSA